MDEMAAPEMKSLSGGGGGGPKPEAKVLDKNGKPVTFAAKCVCGGPHGKGHNNEDVIVKCAYDDKGVLCWYFKISGWVGKDNKLTKHQMALIEAHVACECGE